MFTIARKRKTVIGDKHDCGLSRVNSAKKLTSHFSNALGHLTRIFIFKILIFYSKPSSWNFSGI